MARIMLAVIAARLRWPAVPTQKPPSGQRAKLPFKQRLRPRKPSVRATALSPTATPMCNVGWPSMCEKPIRRRLSKPHGGRHILDHDRSRPWNDALAQDERGRQNRKRRKPRLTSAEIGSGAGFKREPLKEKAPLETGPRRGRIETETGSPEGAVGFPVGAHLHARTRAVCPIADTQSSPTRPQTPPAQHPSPARTRHAGQAHTRDGGCRVRRAE
jgi:hypothetical protein